jgi:hypothetical protein
LNGWERDDLHHHIRLNRLAVWPRVLNALAPAELVGSKRLEKPSTRRNLVVALRVLDLLQQHALSIDHRTAIREVMLGGDDLL